MSEQFKPPAPSLEERVATLEMVVIQQSALLQQQSNNFTQQLKLNGQIIDQLQQLRQFCVELSK